ncbi:unnamed protein product, partial [Medioppia subpectinata]
MSRTFAGLSGTYNVRANELALQRNTKTVRCLVYFLDDTQHVFELDRRAKGDQLLDVVFRHLELIERDYFGLQFTETIAHSGHSNARWLDPNKRLRKQLKSSRAPFLLFFKVKFYVTDPSRLLEEYTRYHFFLQIRKDIVSARLVAPSAALALLCSLVVQCKTEFGDFCAEEHDSQYVSRLKLVPNQSADFEEKVSELHALHRGQTPADAELNFLIQAKALDMYGVELHKAKDTNGREIQIGVSGSGLLILHNGQKANHFSWAKIVKISFKRRHFFVQLRREGVSPLLTTLAHCDRIPDSQTERFDALLGFNSCSYRTCKSLWKACVEQHTFFRLQTPKPHTKKFFFFFSLGSRFRYSGKTEFQTLEENRKRLQRTDRTFVRTARFHQTVPIPHINNLMLSLSNGQSRDSFQSNRIQSTESPAKSAWNASSPFCLKSLPFIDKEETNRLSSLSDDSSPVHLHTVHMRPDADGRFGFNVKGGHDQNCPVLVSRVAP